MKALDIMNSPTLYLEIGHASLKVLDGEDGLELSLERSENGRLTPLCRERLITSLGVFLRKHQWRPRPRAVCAIGARGVSLRQLSLPAASKEELQRLLLLQIEREFPLAPDELAWGYRQLPRVSGNGSPASQELLVVAVKKEVLQEYSEILAGCGLTPVFTLGALARNSLCRQPPKSYALLDIGPNQSELISFANGVPSAIRILPWGAENITRAIEKRLDITHAQAEELNTRFQDGPNSSDELGEKIEGALGAEVHALAGLIQPNWIGERLYVTGASARPLAPRLAGVNGIRAECEPLETANGEGRSAAIFGLKRSCEEDSFVQPLILQLKPAKEAETFSGPAQWKWAAVAALLLICSFSLRYAEAFLFKPRLTRKLAEIKAYRDKLPNTERELAFLQYLKTNQPAYLEPISAIAAASSGTHVDSLSLTRRGDLSLRASMRDSQQVVQFRSKLIESGFFSSVVVEEQTPDKQKINVRIVGQWKPSSDQKATGISRKEVDTSGAQGSEPGGSRPPKVPEPSPAPVPSDEPGYPPPGAVPPITTEAISPAPPVEGEGPGQTPVPRATSRRSRVRSNPNE